MEAAACYDIAYRFCCFLFVLFLFCFIGSLRLYGAVCVGELKRRLAFHVFLIRAERLFPFSLSKATTAASARDMLLRA
jgi:tellurite resistance protein TehA-like permease